MTGPEAVGAVGTVDCAAAGMVPAATAAINAMMPKRCLCGRQIMADPPFWNGAPMIAKRGAARKARDGQARHGPGAYAPGASAPFSSSRMMSRSLRALPARSRGE